MKYLAIRLMPGQDLRATLLRLCQSHQIDAGCVVTCVGSLQRAALRLADGTTRQTFEGPLEIVSLAGTLSRHGLHLHVAVADARGVVRGGHLCEGSPIHTTAEVVIGVLPGLAFKRAPDAATGYDELRIEPL